MRYHPNRFDALLLVLLLLPACNACAPRAEKLDAPIAHQVQQGLDSGQGTFDHSALDALLQAHVRFADGRVDYAGLKQDEPRLDAYLVTVADAQLDTLSRDELMALLINAYNAYTLKLILEHYPGLKSIRDTDKPWDTARYKVGGHTVSLNDLEHGLLRPVFKDPRVHFAVNCASIGCPPLRDHAWSGVDLEAQLAEAARGFARNPRYVAKVDGGVRISRLLDWYGGDFVNPDYHGHAASVPAWLATSAEGELAEALAADPTVSYFDYDWALNDASR